MRIPYNLIIYSPGPPHPCPNVGSHPPVSGTDGSMSPRSNDKHLIPIADFGIRLFHPGNKHVPLRYKIIYIYTISVGNKIPAIKCGTE